MGRLRRAHGLVNRIVDVFIRQLWGVGCAKLSDRIISALRPRVAADYSPRAHSDTLDAPILLYCLGRVLGAGRRESAGPWPESPRSLLIDTSYKKYDGAPQHPLSTRPPNAGFLKDPGESRERILECEPGCFSPGNYHQIIADGHICQMRPHSLAQQSLDPVAND